MDLNVLNYTASGLREILKCCMINFIFLRKRYNILPGLTEAAATPRRPPAACATSLLSSDILLPNAHLKTEIQD